MLQRSGLLRFARAPQDDAVILRKCPWGAMTTYKGSNYYTNIWDRTLEIEFVKHALIISSLLPIMFFKPSTMLKSHPSPDYFSCKHCLNCSWVCCSHEDVDHNGS